MTMHKLIVISMLAVTTVLAVRYVSRFPVEGEDAPGHTQPGQLLESSEPVLPASGTSRPAERRLGSDVLRYLA